MIAMTVQFGNHALIKKKKMNNFEQKIERIFKRGWKQANNKTKDSVYWGVFLSKKVDNYINLYSLAFRVTKADIFRSIFNSWKKSNSIDEQKLLDKIVLFLQDVWIQIKMDFDSYNKDSFSEFTQSIKKVLLKKHLTEAQIEKIIKGIVE